MRKLTELVPDVETLLEMEPAELAGIAIEQLISAEKAGEKTYCLYGDSHAGAPQQSIWSF